ncbi:MAG TPA: tetratricopeptide repeat protein [Pirellulales bacterium]|nr:tetratricopeptide repeat protein [Pirellulales bacterium]
MTSSRPQSRPARGSSLAPEPTKSRAAPFWISLALATATVVAYAGCLQNGFVNFDDDRYVVANPHVRRGICAEEALWALTTTDCANWHPLTWLFLELDTTLFGVRASGYHAVNLLLHCANTLLLFGLLRQMTGAVGRSAAVAGFFALHPLHVESVAWIAERKDVLSGLFFLLTVWAYHRYVLSPGWRRYVFVLSTYAVGLTAKPMLVTLPFVLVLLDHWPLGRLRTNVSSLAEKLPFFMLSLASCVVTYRVQELGGAVQSAEQLSIMARLANLPIAYAEYLAKTVWPVRLAVYYPLPHGTTLVAPALVATAFLLTLTGVAIFCWGRRPYLTVGWLWWLGMLVPVIGIVQVGGQAYADRYTYLPMIGLLIAVVWGGHELAARGGAPRWLTAGAVAALLVGCTLITRLQVGYWHDGVSLWQHALEVTSPNPVALNSLGVALAETGRAQEAVVHFERGLALEPDDERCHQNLAIALVALRRFDESLDHFQRALRVNPNNGLAHFNAGVLVERNGQHAAAIEHFRRALAIDPNYWRAHLQLGRVLLKTGETELGEHHLHEALRLNPELINDAGTGVPESGSDAPRRRRQSCCGRPSPSRSAGAT